MAVRGLYLLYITLAATRPRGLHSRGCTSLSLLWLVCDPQPRGLHSPNLPCTCCTSSIFSLCHVLLCCVPAAAVVGCLLWLAAGKTFTMEGVRKEDGALDADSPNSGIIARAVRRVFETLQASGSEHVVKISYMQIYNEKCVEACRPHSARDRPGCPLL